MFYIIIKFIILLVAVWSTAWTINYKYTTAIKLFKFHEEEDKKMAKFSFITLHVCIFAWALYFTIY